MRTIMLGLVCAAALLASQQSPDNSKANKDQGKPTADQQSNASRDVEITKEIRRSVTEIDTMSTYAKNVKIITKDGLVTLRGPVKTAAERTEIEQIAKRVAGDTSVKNELEVSK